MSQDADEKALTEQIRWYYKLKYTVLVLCLGMLWLVWSAVRTGEQTLKAINGRSVEARQKWMTQAATAQKAPAQKAPLTPQKAPRQNAPAATQNAPAPTPESTAAAAQLATSAQSLVNAKSKSNKIDEAVLSDPGSAQIIDEFELQFEGLMVNGISWDKKSEPGRELSEIRYHELQQLMADRENAYNLEFGISNVKSTVVLNALFVIDSWPIILVLVIALVIGISFQQRAVEIMLANMIQHATDEKDKAIQSAATGFTAWHAQPPVTRWRTRVCLSPCLHNDAGTLYNYMSPSCRGLWFNKHAASANAQPNGDAVEHPWLSHSRNCSRLFAILAVT